MKIEKIQFIDQRTSVLLWDIVHLQEISDKSTDKELHCTFARAAINNAVLLLECIANSCLMSLRLPSTLYDEIEKLNTLSKYDYFLFATTGNHLDRSIKQTSLAAEIIKLRNIIVHPKPRPGKLSEISFDLKINYGVLKNMSIPYDTREWTSSTSSIILKSISQFIKSFFVDWCALNKGVVTTLLTCREKPIIENKLKTFIMVPPTAYSLLNKWLPDIFKILDIRKANIA